MGQWPRNNYTGVGGGLYTGVGGGLYVGPGGGLYNGPGGGLYTGPDSNPYYCNWPPAEVLYASLKVRGLGRYVDHLIRAGWR